MDLPIASVQEGDRWRWRDLRTVVAIVAAVATGVGLGTVAGVLYGMDFVFAGSTIEIVDGFAAPRAIQVGGVAAGLVAFTSLLALRSGMLAVADPLSLTRRRAFVVGGIGTVVMIAPWFLIGLPIVMLSRGISGHPGAPFQGELAARALPSNVRLWFYEPGPALIGMVAAFLTVAILGALFRRSSNRP